MEYFRRNIYQSIGNLTSKLNKVVIANLPSVLSDIFIHGPDTFILSGLTLYSAIPNNFQAYPVLSFFDEVNILSCNDVLLY